MTLKRTADDAISEQELQAETRLPIREIRDQPVLSPTVNTTEVMGGPVEQCKVCGTFRHSGLLQTLERYGPYYNVAVCDGCHAKLARQANLVTE